MTWVIERVWVYFLLSDLSICDVTIGKDSAFQNVWRQSSGTFCTWTLTSNVLKSTPFPMERHIFLAWQDKYDARNFTGNKKCDDPWEKGMFQDVDVKIQVRSYLNFDVDVLKTCLFPMDHHILTEIVHSTYKKIW